SPPAAWTGGCPAPGNRRHNHPKAWSRRGSRPSGPPAGRCAACVRFAAMSDDQPSLMRGRRRRLLLAVCAALVAALLAVAALAPLPFSVTYPGSTADVLGESDGEPVIEISGAPVREPDPSGALLL